MGQHGHTISILAAIALICLALAHPCRAQDAPAESTPTALATALVDGAASGVIAGGRSGLAAASDARPRSSADSPWRQAGDVPTTAHGDATAGDPDALTDADTRAPEPSTAGSTEAIETAEPTADSDVGDTPRLPDAKSDDPERRVVEDQLFGAGEPTAESAPVEDDATGGTSETSEPGAGDAEGDAPPSEREALEDELFGGGETGDSDTPSEREALEDELFGGGDEDRQAGDAVETGDDPRDDDIFGEGSTVTSGDSLLGKLDALEEDPLAIGGQLYMRLQADYSEGTDFEDTRLTSPNLLDLYLDARPNDRLRAFVRGRLRHDFTIAEQRDTAAFPDLGGMMGGDGGDGGDTDVDAALPGSGTLGASGEETTVDLDQLWLKFDIAKRVFFTVGRQPVRWGTGRFWNPTDFLNQQTRDPLAVFDERLGVSLIKLHIPIESVNMNIYTVAMLEDVSSPADIGGALRWEWLVDLTEMALSVAVQRDEPLRLGVDVSSGVWLFDVRLEGAATYDDENTRYWEGELDIPSFTFPTAFTRDDEWTFQTVAGADLTFEYGEALDTITVGVEYFFNQVGYERSDIYPWLLVNGDFRPLFGGVHYGALYALIPSPGSWNDTTIIASVLGNLSDPTFVTRLDWRVRVLTWLDLVAWGTVFAGEEGEFRPSLSIPPLMGVEGLEDGLEVPPPLLQLGIGALMRI